MPGPTAIDDTSGKVLRFRVAGIVFVAKLSRCPNWSF